MLASDIRTHYETIREQENNALAERTAHARTLCPMLADLAAAREETMRTFMQALGSTAATCSAAQTKQQLEAIAAQEADLLAQCGLPADYLTLHVRCALCGDTGYVGELLRKPCLCLQRLQQFDRRASSRINDEETFETFDEHVFSSDAQRKQMCNARDFLIRFTNAYPHTDKHNLLLTGMAGLGKSFLINCIAARLVARDFSLEKVTAYALQEHIRNGIRTNTNGVRRFIDTPLLLIDDLGTEPMFQNITREYLFSILNERRSGKRHTIVATNLSIEQLQERYGERIFSRLVSADDTFILHFTGENLRMRKQP